MGCGLRYICYYYCPLKNQFELIKSVPGVGDKTAIYMLIVTRGFTAFNNARKFACYAGTAPFEYSSGSSIKGRTKVNHMADKKNEINITNVCFSGSETRPSTQRIL